MPGRPFHVTIVCSGNTCRSPMAEGILKKALADRGVEGIAVTSAGTLGIIDAPATPAAVETARSFGVDIAGHRSQGFTKELAQSSDLILALAVEHYEAALVMGIPEDKVFMLNAYPRRTRDLYTASIQDPIGGDFDMYRRAFLTIDDALQRSVGDIIRQAVAREKGKENNKE